MALPIQEHEDILSTMLVQIFVGTVVYLCQVHAVLTHLTGAPELLRDVKHASVLLLHLKLCQCEHALHRKCILRPCISGHDSRLRPQVALHALDALSPCRCQQ